MAKVQPILQAHFIPWSVCRPTGNGDPVKQRGEITNDRPLVSRPATKVLGAGDAPSHYAIRNAENRFTTTIGERQGRFTTSPSSPIRFAFGSE